MSLFTFTDYSSQIDTISRLLKNGKVKKAQFLLRNISAKKIPRDFRAQFANLAWRSGLEMLALKILSSAMKKNRRSTEAATSFERLEYSIALMRIGSLSEAKKILEDISRVDIPESLKYLGYVYIHEWDYISAAKTLHLYLQQNQLNDYERAIAQVNYLSALIASDQITEADKVSEDLLINLKRDRHLRLYANVCELKSQIYLQTREWGKAKSFLNQADEITPYRWKAEKLYIRKWRAILNGRQGHEFQSASQLKEVRRKAIRLQQWEVVRDCDFWHGFFSRSEDEMLKAYFCTPYPSYKERLEVFFNEIGLRLPDEFLFYPFKNKKNASNRIDLKLGTSSEKKFLKGKFTLVKLLRVLSGDIYLPPNIGGLFSQIYPEEFFDHVNSPTRIHQLLFRFRESCEQSNIPVSIKSENSRYELDFFGPVEMIYKKNAETGADQTDGRLILLKEHFGGEKFSTKEASNALDLSPRMIQRILKSGSEDGKLEFSGKARARTYWFSEDKVA